MAVQMMTASTSFWSSILRQSQETLALGKICVASLMRRSLMSQMATTFSLSMEL